MMDGREIRDGHGPFSRTPPHALEPFLPDAVSIATWQLTLGRRAQPPRDSEPLDERMQRRPLHAETGRSAPGAGDQPVRLLEDGKESDAEAITTVVYMVKQGHVRLCGTFKGSRFDRSTLSVD